MQSYGGFDIRAQPGTSFVISYEANHPVSGEIFTAQRGAVVADDSRYGFYDEDVIFHETAPPAAFVNNNPFTRINPQLGFVYQEVYQGVMNASGEMAFTNICSG